MSKHPSSPTPELPADPSALPDDPAVLRDMVLLLTKELRARFSRRSSAASTGGAAAPPLAYAQANWRALNVYVTDGDLSIDNNAAERAMKHAVTGRRNWLFFGSDRGGEMWAVITSLLYSAKLHGLNPYAYLRDVLMRIADSRLSELEQYLPDVWKREHMGSVRPPEAEESAVK